MTTPSPPDRLLTVHEVHGRLKISESAIWSLLRDKTLPSVKLKGRRLVRESDLDQFIGGLG